MKSSLVTQPKSALIIKSRINTDPEKIHLDNIQIYSFLNQPSLSAATRIHYERVIRDFFNFFSAVSLKEVQEVHVTVYLKKIEKSASTKNFILKALSSLFGYLFNVDYVPRNPVVLLKPEKVADTFRFKILTIEQIDRMIDLEQDIMHKTLLKILYFTGLRISEALSLKKDSFRDAPGGGAYMTVIGKGTKVRTVFIPPELFKDIKAYLEVQSLEKDNYIFFAKLKTENLSRFQAFRIIKAAAKVAQIDPLPSPHWFRHSSATHAIENGAPIHVVQHTLGHASINTTGKYLHASPTESTASYLTKS